MKINSYTKSLIRKAVNTYAEMCKSYGVSVDKYALRKQLTLKLHLGEITLEDIKKEIKWEE